MPRARHGVSSNSPRAAFVAIQGALILVAAAGHAAARPVTVAWDPNPEPDLAGYYVEYGAAPGATEASLDVGKTTTALLTLPDGRRYYLRVRAYNQLGLVSPPSNEVVVDLGASWSGTDADGDGLPDDWEAAYGATSPSADPDGDGVTNLEEFERGTDPTLPNRVVLSEGSTGFFRERVALVNPGPVEAQATLTFLTPAGVADTRGVVVPAQSRRTIDVNAIAAVAASPVSIVVDIVRGGLAAERTMFWFDAGGGMAGHTGKAVARSATSWFLAEGEARVFDAWILLANGGTLPATVTADFLTDAGAIVRRTYRVPAGARETVYVNAIPGVAGRAFSTRLTSDRPITVERAMYFGRPGRGWEGGHASAAVASASRTWFVAEGRTGPFFDTYLLLANPQAQPVSVTLSYLRPAGPPVVETHTLPATSRTTILVDAVPGLADTDVSVAIAASAPIAVERAMYWPEGGWTDGHASAAVDALGTRWVLAEGETGGRSAFDTYVLVANPNPVAATLAFTFLREAGAPVRVTRTVGPNARLTLWSGELPLLPGERFGIVVDASAPVAVERSMYWSSGGRFWRGGTNETGLRVR